MGKYKNFIIGMFIFSLIITGNSIFGRALEIQETKNKNMKLTLSLVFDPKEAVEFKTSLKNALLMGEQYYKDLIASTTDEDKKQYLMNILDASQKADIDSCFETASDGNVYLDIPYKNADVSINGVEERSNKNGVVETEKLNNIAPYKKSVKRKPLVIDEKFKMNADRFTNLCETNDMIITKNNMEIEGEEIFYDNDENEIKIFRTLEELGEGAMRMGEQMNAEGQAVKLYPKKSVGGSLGAGAGKTKVVKDINIVVCNKHDKNTNSVTQAQFLKQHSDCSNSIFLGLNSMIFGGYPYSEYCVDEAVSNETGRNNAYCNGTTKMANGTSKGNHINCSWFAGINHTEEFHTHK